MSNVDKKTPKERMIERIKATKIIKRVNDCALGKEEMTQVELNAARLIIGKVLPDLKAIDLKQDGAFEIINRITRTIVEPEHTDS